MPRPDAVAAIARNLHSLPHPDGRPRRLMHFSQFGHTPDVQQTVAALGQDIAAAIVHTLERDGFTISHRHDPKEPRNADGPDMTEPTAEELTAMQSMMPKSPRDLMAHLRAPESRAYSAVDGITFVERLMHALHTTERFPINVSTTHESDDSLTIRITPQS